LLIPQRAESNTKVLRQLHGTNIAAASVLLLVASATILLEHLQLISRDWSLGTVLFLTLSVCALAAYFEYRSA